MIGLAEMMQIESMADRSGLYRVWELLFGGVRSFSKPCLPQ